MPSYIIHSGWWCDGSRVHPGATKYSDARIRTQDFFDVWYDFVRTYTNPEKIIIVDSASPVRPRLEGKDVEFVSMKRNFLHGMTCDTKYCGASRAILTGAFYSFINDAEYSVFIEQDCLVYGKDIVERGIEAMNGKKISFALGGPNRSCHSLMIIHRDFYLKLLNGYMAIPETDKEMDTEDKYLKVAMDENEFIPLPYGYARNRPINFRDSHFYAQQWRKNELTQLLDLVEFDSLKRLLGYEKSPALKMRRLVKKLASR